ncbi:Tyrocidine synthase 1 [Pseudomonas aeruginosa]|uniref:class I adenylate-forming enzyme family protein n=1 Tax=Pseudomonas aeruginosa TaxID=287 RepID=UPI000F2883B0|nr:class I adenylate-forming enzyme family protein [Pseudomonas aeruginosa]VCY94707.1 Tyrocidine synthase 1 [Pseudomonas aeruginosa]
MSSLPVPVSLDSTLRHLGSADPRRPFLIDAREPERPLEYTWGDADRQVDALAEQIAAHACRSVGVLLDNSYRNLCLIYAVMRAGKHLVLIDPEWGEAAKQAIVDEMRLEALASEHPLEGALAGLRLALDFERSATRRLDRAAHSHMILFTSGTTGQPKGIELSQQAMLHAYRIGRDCLGIGEHTRSGCFYRISGLGILGINFLFPLLYGGSAVLLPLHCWADSEGFWEWNASASVSSTCRRWSTTWSRKAPRRRAACRCSACSASPARRAWTPTCRRPSSATTRRWRTSTASASAASPSSSASVAAMRSTTRWDLPSAWNSLTDPDGRPLEGSGERGRLWVRTPSLFSGYVNRPDLTAQVLEDGWLNTQDLAYFDEDRCVHVLGRCDGTINKGGNLFHLNECERALNGLDEVIDVCCLKVDCPLYGEDYVAVIHTAPQVEFAFLPWLQQQLGTLRAPQRVVLSHQALPLNGAGKHDRRALAALLQREAS